MNNLEIYENAFVSIFKIEDMTALNSLSYQGTLLWDSVGHMELIARLESEFNIMFDMDDVIDFSSFQKGKDLLKKYGVVI